MQLWIMPIITIRAAYIAEHYDAMGVGAMTSSRDGEGLGSRKILADLH